ncbi:hypothetical protein EYF80_057655 [Liparis tanakae]|uniref:Uncharacterized protein n=1 Tax=Liparis tanakae TaxID=230148 RepID=A0A4Z2ETR4_9TELE|nr:hypothetical protein EYF80_057655 [Liparis tanakae]
MAGERAGSQSTSRASPSTRETPGSLSPEPGQREIRKGSKREAEAQRASCLQSIGLTREEVGLAEYAGDMWSIF